MREKKIGIEKVASGGVQRPMPGARFLGWGNRHG